MNDAQAAYLALLAKWNRRINLTSLAVDPPNKDALDRLLYEPEQASKLLERSDCQAIDLGSGGGSPALPLKIACPWLRLVLVESRVKKCAFLREAARELQLDNVEVQHCRFEELKVQRPDLACAADVVTFRAVRVDDQFWTIVSWLVSPQGKVFWFGGEPAKVPTQFSRIEVYGAFVLAQQWSRS